MSLYNHEVVRAGGELMAVVWIQNDYTGGVTRSLKSIREENGQYYIKADGRKHNITPSVKTFQIRQDTINRALTFYERNNGRLYG